MSLFRVTRPPPERCREMIRVWVAQMPASRSVYAAKHVGTSASQTGQVTGTFFAFRRTSGSDVVSGSSFDLERDCELRYTEAPVRPRTSDTGRALRCTLTMRHREQ